MEKGKHGSKQYMKEKNVKEIKRNEEKKMKKIVGCRKRLSF